MRYRPALDGGRVTALATAPVVCYALRGPDGSPLLAALSWPPVRWVGRLSYSLYVVHFPIAVAMQRSSLSPNRRFVVDIALAFTAVIVLRYGVEQPLLRARNRVRRSRAVLERLAPEQA
jgi:peptidoglycan/LPS O-acetylase OafA/YrhL